MNCALKLGVTHFGVSVTTQDTANPHLAILGRSGSGKSYFLHGLIEQAAQQGASCLILDYSADFHSYAPPDSVSFRRINVTDPRFSINPLAASAAGGGLAAAQQLLSALHSAFHMGPRATLALQKTTLDYAKQSAQPTITGLLKHIEKMDKKSAGLTAAMEPLSLLTTLIHCGNEPISIDLTQSGIIALGFDQIMDNKFRALLAELILQTVWNQWTVETHNPDHPLILVLDECQNLSWSEDSMAVHILREGRKFGIGGWFASQWLSNKTAIAALGQAALQANFRPEDSNIPTLAKRLAQSDGTPTQWQKLLQKLKVGQFVYSRKDGKGIVVNVPARTERVS